MANLVIKGHATRGQEVIEILEMLGGKTRHGRFAGHELSCGYYITMDGYIGFKHYSLFDDITIFTLEEFLEKFPYKVGDKVIYDKKVFNVVEMMWNKNLNTISYGIYNGKRKELSTIKELQPYKEEPMYLNRKVNEQAEEINKILEPVKEIMEEIKLDIPDGYEFFDIDDDNKIVLTKKQPQYPKNYEECCKVLDIQSDWHLTFELNNPVSCDLCVKNEFEYVCKLEAFRKLLICRDAYWKIAGEQMRLGKPWKPQFENCSISHYCIFINHTGEIYNDCFYVSRCLLAFPTKEMRDAFYENFKNAIETCKELL